LAFVLCDIMRHNNLMFYCYFKYSLTRRNGSVAMHCNLKVARRHTSRSCLLFAKFVLRLHCRSCDFRALGTNFEIAIRVLVTPTF